jgi:hypothetical protein
MGAAIDFQGRLTWPRTISTPGVSPSKVQPRPTISLSRNVPWDAAGKKWMVEQQTPDQRAGEAAEALEAGGVAVKARAGAGALRGAYDRGGRGCTGVERA